MKIFEAYFGPKSGGCLQPRCPLWLICGLVHRSRHSPDFLSLQTAIR